MSDLPTRVEELNRLARIAALPQDHLVLVCDGCGKCWPDDSASDEESCDCGRFKQRMEWATPVDVAKDAQAALAAHQRDAEWYKLLAWGFTRRALHGRDAIVTFDMETSVRVDLDAEGMAIRTDELEKALRQAALLKAKGEAREDV